MRGVLPFPQPPSSSSSTGNSRPQFTQKASAACPQRKNLHHAVSHQIWFVLITLVKQNSLATLPRSMTVAQWKIMPNCCCYTNWQLITAESPVDCIWWSDGSIIDFLLPWTWWWHKQNQKYYNSWHKCVVFILIQLKRKRRRRSWNELCLITSMVQSYFPPLMWTKVWEFLISLFLYCENKLGNTLQLNAHVP